MPVYTDVSPVIEMSTNWLHSHLSQINAWFGKAFHKSQSNEPLKLDVFFIIIIQMYKNY